jgi:hypothetical protein
METRSITAAFLAQNFSELLNQVRYQHVTLEVTRGNDLVAYVSPPPRVTGYPIAQAGQFLADIHEAGTMQSVDPDAWGS